MANAPSRRLPGQVYRLFHLGAVGTMTDAELLDRFVSGRDESAEAAFEELVIRHAPMVLQVCRAVLHDAHDAEDAFQAVFLVLASRAGSIRRAGSIASWLFGVARRVAARSRRGAARRRTLDRRVAERNPEGYLPAGEDPDRDVLHEEIDGLPERLRGPVVLCYLQGVSYADAAHRLGISETAIRGRLARARDRLRRRLTGRGVTVPAGVLIAGTAGHVPAALPGSLIHSTIRIALGFAAGRTAAALARGVLTAMLLYQLRVATVFVCLGLGGGYSAWQAAAAAGDGQGQTPAGERAPTVRLVRPSVRTIVRVIGQPSFIESYERTPIYPGPGGDIEKSIAHIGDRVKKGDVLATLFVPGPAGDLADKKSTVNRLEQRLDLARAALDEADAGVLVTRALLAEARAILAKSQAEVDLWDAEVQRLEREVKRGVVEPQVLLESKNHRKAGVATRDAARATIASVEADLHAREAALAKAKVEFSVDRADLAAAASEVKRLEERKGPPTPPAGAAAEAAAAEVKAARARLVGAAATRAAYATDVDRWDAELKRLRHAIDPRSLREAIDRSTSDAAREAARVAAEKSAAAREAARAAIGKAEADLAAYRATLAKAGVEASVAAAALAVAESEEQRIRAWVGSFAITAPHDGLVVDRNAGRLDLARPSTGPTTSAKPTHQPTPPGPAPLFVVDRIDVVRVFVEITESDAGYVRVGTRASVRVKAAGDRPIASSVTRTSWGVKVKRRVLRAEIDLPNPDGRLKPGMYAHAEVILERPGAQALPAAAVASVDGKSYCWTYKDGRAVRTEIETGLGDGRWIEVLHRRAPAAGGTPGGEGPWAPLDDSERVIVGDLSTLRDDAPVQVDPASKGPE